MQIEHAELSLIGDRSENQDRVMAVAADGAALMICVDGMGGHSDGAKAAESVVQTIAQAFTRVTKPVFDPQGFLHMVIGRAHTSLVAMGMDQAVDARPRATCAVCLLQDDSAFWAHVGDSRIYLVRDTAVMERTRDHSHVELLLREGVISEAEIAEHPMRNLVECCLGGDARLPGMSITGRKTLVPGDTLLACTDGLWSGLGDDEIGQHLDEGRELGEGLRALGQQAVEACEPYADNTSAVAVRVGNRKATP